MIPVVQSIVGDGRDGRPNGDCFRACVASIFELPLDQVPHFLEPQVSRWFLRAQEWLKQFALALDYDSHPAAARPPRYPRGWWIASVESELFPGSQHAVVMRGIELDTDEPPWRVAWDPSPRPRTTPYVFRGATWFVALDPAAIARRAP